MIAHIVLFEPKASVTPEAREAFLDAMKVAFAEIPTVTRSLVGETKKIGASYEAKLGDKTYSYASVVEFEDMSGLMAYLEHPLHERLGHLFWENCARTMILDVDCFWLNAKK